MGGPGVKKYLVQILLHQKNMLATSFIIRQHTTIIIHQKMDFLNKIAEYREKTIYRASVVVSFVPIAKASHARVHWRSVTCMYLTVDLRYTSTYILLCWVWVRYILQIQDSPWRIVNNSILSIAWKKNSTWDLHMEFPLGDFSPWPQSRWHSFWT